MLFHSQYFLLALSGQKIDWKVSGRAEQRTGFWEALRVHGPGTLLGILWGTVVFFTNPDFFGWFCIFLVPLVFSIPLSMASSHIGMGIGCKKIELFLIPEELNPP